MHITTYIWVIALKVLTLALLMDIGLELWTIADNPAEKAHKTHQKFCGVVTHNMMCGFPIRKKSREQG